MGYIRIAGLLMMGVGLASVSATTGAGVDGRVMFEDRESALAGMAISEELLNALPTQDWEAVATLYGSRKPAITAARLERQIGPVLRKLGEFEYAVLVDIGLGADNCQRRTYALRFSSTYTAKLLAVICDDDSGKPALLGFSVDASPQTQARMTISGALANRLKRRFPDPHCAAADTASVGESFTCIATTDDGESFRILGSIRQDGKVQLDTWTSVGVAPEPTRELLEASATAILALYSAREYQAMYDDAAPALRRKHAAASFVGTLRAVHDRLGSIRISTWTGSGVTSSGVHVAEFEIGYAEQEAVAQVGLLPHTGRWLLAGINMDATGVLASDPKAQAASLLANARKLTLDPTVTLDCLHRLPFAEGTSETCTGTAYGRPATFELHMPPADQSSIGQPWMNMSITNSELILRVRMETLKPLLGWALDSLVCENPALGIGEITRCTARSKDGDRTIQVVHRGNDLRVVEVLLL